MKLIGCHNPCEILLAQDFVIPDNYRECIYIPNSHNCPPCVFPRRNALQTKVEHMYELPQLTVSVTKAQAMLIAHVLATWTERNPSPQQLLSLSLVEDVFKGTNVAHRL